MSPTTVKGLGAVVAVILLVFVVRSCSGSSVPEAFADLSTRFQEASTIQVDFYWDHPKTQKENFCELRVTDRDLAVLDMGGSQARLSLKDGSVRLVTPDVNPPIPALNDRATDLYEEIRAGFSNSEWSMVDPAMDETLAERDDLLWGRFILPFSWAEGHEIFVGIANAGASPEVVVIRTSGALLGVSYRQNRGGPTTARLSDGPELWVDIEDLRINQSLSPSLLKIDEHP